MAVPTSTIWERDPHTAAKHQILDRYLAGWFPIMLHSTYWRSVTYLDGFAGPGEYSKGEDGSPLIALKRLLDHPALLATRHPVRFVFIEENRQRAEHLRQLIEQRYAASQRPSHVTVDVYCGTCQTTAIPALNSAGAWTQPVFANLDPFGPNVPLDLVRRLGRNAGSEVLVTFPSDWLRRFATETHLQDGDKMFGDRGWREVRLQPDPKSKERFLVAQYESVLRRAGFPLPSAFKLVDEGGRSFWLVHGTRHPLGLEKMKDAMWDTDPISGFSFRDPRDPDQATLFQSSDWSPDIESLVMILEQQLRDVGGSATVQDLRDFAFYKTVYRVAHANQAIRAMLDRRAIQREPSAGRIEASNRLSLARTRV
jgi:three-Cys-motif partner protein